MDRYFFDTNAILELGDEILNNPFVYISSVTLTELEEIKTNKNKTEDIRYKARKATHLIDNNYDKFNIINYDENIKHFLEYYNLFETPDNIICASAAYVADHIADNTIFVTADISCRNIARGIFELKTKSVDDKKEYIYKGYKELSGTSDEINEKMFDENYINSFYENEYLLIDNKDTGIQSEMKYSNGKFDSLKLPPSKYVKALNQLQRCALDILNNQNIPIAAILGGYGSGKTYLSMKMGLYHVNEKGNQAKILGVREPYGEGKEVGFLPGDLENKTDSFFLPLQQQLDGGVFELENLKQCGVLESNIPFYMKGTTYDNTIILVDEAEDLSAKSLRLVGTRLGKNSRIFLAGDYKQAVINASNTNPLVEMCNEFKGNPKFACIYLGEDVRSEASKMFASLFT